MCGVRDVWSEGRVQCGMCGVRDVCSVGCVE